MRLLWLVIVLILFIESTAEGIKTTSGSASGAKGGTVARKVNVPKAKPKARPASTSTPPTSTTTTEKDVDVNGKVASDTSSFAYTSPSAAGSSEVVLDSFAAYVPVPVSSVAAPPLPHPSASTVEHTIENAGTSLLWRTGSLYGIDLTKSGFEQSFARKMSETDTDLLEIHMTGSDKDSASAFSLARDVLQHRYYSLFSEFKDVAGVWFFLSCVASGDVSPSEVDEAVVAILQLARKAVQGTPFYPEEVVAGLMETSTAKMKSDLGVLVKTVGDNVLHQQWALASAPSPSSSSSSSKRLVSAEFFQFWQQLCLFAERHASYADLKTRHTTLVRSATLNITLANLLPGGGPLNSLQLESLSELLSAEIEAAAEVHTLSQRAAVSVVLSQACDDSWEDGEEGPASSTSRADTSSGDSSVFRQTETAAAAASAVHVTAVSDVSSFFSGFSHLRRGSSKLNQQDGDEVVLCVGARHLQSRTRFAEFQFLVEVFRGLQRQVSESVASRQAGPHAAGAALQENAALATACANRKK